VNGTLTLTEGALGAGTGTIDAKGALVVGAGFDGAANAQGTLLLIDGAGDQSFVVPSGASLPRMTLNNSLTTMSFAAGASASLTGDFTLQAGAFTRASATLTINRSDTQTAGTFTEGSNALTIDNGDFKLYGGTF